MVVNLANICNLVVQKSDRLNLKEKQDNMENNNTCWSMPRIGDQAPEFRAMTTHGKLNFPGDYAGKWKILFSHPADFTPVCTTEFIAFAKMQDG